MPHCYKAELEPFNLSAHSVLLPSHKSHAVKRKFKKRCSVKPRSAHTANSSFSQGHFWSKANAGFCRSTGLLTRCYSLATRHAASTRLRAAGTTLRVREVLQHLPLASLLTSSPNLFPVHVVCLCASTVLWLEQLFSCSLPPV